MIETVSFSITPQFIHTLGTNFHTTVLSGKIRFAVIDRVHQFFCDNVWRDGFDAIYVTVTSSTFDHTTK